MIHKRMHHVGIIMPTEDDVWNLMNLYGLELDCKGETPYECRYYFTKMNAAYSDSPIEFLVAQGGPLKDFNHGKGGIHHICFEVDDIDKTCEELRAKGLLLLENESQISDKTMKINFVRPKSSHGILVEFMQIVNKGAGND